MFGLGHMELLVIFGLVVLIFGATKIPQLGKGLGEGIRNFKKGLRGDSGEDDFRDVKRLPPGDTSENK